VTDGRSVGSFSNELIVFVAADGAVSERGLDDDRLLYVGGVERGEPNTMAAKLSSNWPGSLKY
jgi:hypothetical protein